MRGYGYKIKKLREQHDMTRSQLAQELGLSTSTISMYEREKRKPRDEIKMQIAELFNLEVKDIFFTN